MFKKIYKQLIVMGLVFSTLSLLHGAHGKRKDSWDEVISQEITPKELQTFLQEKTHMEKELNAKFLQVAKSSHFETQKKKDALATLLEQKASIFTVDNKGESALYKVIQCAGCYQRADDTIVELLLRNKSPLTGTFAGRSLIERSIGFKMYAVLEKLVAAGVDINAVCDDTGTDMPIHMVASATWLKDADASKMLDILVVGDLHVNAHSLRGNDGVGHTAMCMTKSPLIAHERKLFAQKLILYGASSYCANEVCRQESRKLINNRSKATIVSLQTPLKSHL